VRDHDEVAPFVLPRNLADSAAQEPSEGRADWVRSLPGMVAQLARQWSLRVGQPFQPGGRCAWVAPARDPDGRDLVLKIGWRHFEALHEADALSLWDGDGAVRLHAADSFDDTSALLLERCRPGTAANRSLPEPVQDEVVAELLRRLWRQPPAGNPFRLLQVMCDRWADERESGLVGLPGGLDPGLARAGISLFRWLPTTAPRQVVLCTDLHAENILAGHREPWLVIDPKPFVGDPTYDVLQHMLNCQQRLLADPLAFADRMAELADLDPTRLRLWLFARCVQEGLDDPALAEVAARIAPA
jgi:streptomycin 6-kinase